MAHASSSAAAAAQRALAVAVTRLSCRTRLPAQGGHAHMLDGTEHGYAHEGQDAGGGFLFSSTAKFLSRTKSRGAEVQMSKGGSAVAVPSACMQPDVTAAASRHSMHAYMHVPAPPQQHAIVNAAQKPCTEPAASYLLYSPLQLRLSASRRRVSSSYSFSTFAGACAAALGGAGKSGRGGDAAAGGGGGAAATGALALASPLAGGPSAAS